MKKQTGPFITVTAPKMRAINRSSILEFIRCSGPISQLKIAAELQVSLPTVMRIVDNLISEGWVHELGEKEWSGGRKRVLVEFNGADHLMIGIDLGGTKIFGALVNFNGEIIHEIYLKHRKAQAEDSLQLVFQVVDELLRVAAQGKVSISGIGIGVPGITNPETGIVSFAPALHWQGFPLTARLMAKYPYPIVIENDVNLAALGEAWFGTGGSNEKNLVLIAIGTGIGAGVVINGNIYSGVHHMAGEIGYLLLQRDHLGKVYSDFGAFEQVASGTGIADRGRQLLAQQVQYKARKSITAEDVFTAARRHESWAETVVEDTIDYLAQAIAAITLICDPGVILLGGGVSRSADLLIEPILKRLEGSIPNPPRMRVSQLGYRAAVVGAVMQLMRRTMDFFTI
jgi:glucokinase